MFRQDRPGEVQFRRCETTMFPMTNKFSIRIRIVVWQLVRFCHWLSLWISDLSAFETPSSFLGLEGEFLGPRGLAPRFYRNSYREGPTLPQKLEQFASSFLEVPMSYLGSVLTLCHLCLVSFFRFSFTKVKAKHFKEIVATLCPIHTRAR